MSSRFWSLALAFGICPILHASERFPPESLHIAFRIAPPDSIATDPVLLAHSKRCLPFNDGTQTITACKIAGGMALGRSNPYFAMVALGQTIGLIYLHPEMVTQAPEKILSWVESVSHLAASDIQRSWVYIADRVRPLVYRQDSSSETPAESAPLTPEEKKAADAIENLLAAGVLGNIFGPSSVILADDPVAHDEILAIEEKRLASDVKIMEETIAGLPATSATIAQQVVEYLRLLGEVSAHEGDLDIMKMGREIKEVPPPKTDEMQTEWQKRVDRLMTDQGIWISTPQGQAALRVIKHVFGSELPF